MESKQIIVEGIKFNSIKSACEHYNTAYRRVRWRIANGWSPEEAFGVVDRKEYKYEFNGKKYNSVRSLYYDNEKELQRINNNNIYYKKISNRIANGWTYEEALGLKPRNIKKKSTRSVTVDGVEYNSISQAAKKYNIDYTKVSYRINNGWSMEEVFELEGSKKDRLNIDLIVNDIKYKSVAALARAYNIKYSKLLWRLKHGGMTAEEALGLVESTKNKKYIYNNKFYSSYKEIYNDNITSPKTLKYSKFINRIRNGWTISEALGIKIHICKKNKYIPIIRGVEYKSINSAINKLNLEKNKSYIYLEIRKGKSVEEVFEKVLSKKGE